MVSLVVVLAVVASLSPAMTLAAQTRIPIATSTEGLAVTKRASRIALATLSVIIGAIAIPVVGPTYGALTAALCLTTGTYLISLALLARAQDFRKMMLARLSYASTNAIATLGLCLTHAPTLFFLVPPSVAYLFGASFAWTSSWRRRSPIHVTETVQDAWAALPLSGAYLLSGLSGQIGAFATSSLGPLAASWATSVRITSGFQNASIQIVQPEIDIAASKAVREGDSQAVRKAFRSGLDRGLLICAVATPIVIAGAVILGTDAPTSEEIVILGVGIIGYQCSTLVVIPVERLLAMSGGRFTRLAWDAARLLLLSPALLMGSYAAAIAWLGVSGLGLNVTLLFLTNRRLRHG